MIIENKFSEFYSEGVALYLQPSNKRIVSIDSRGYAAYKQFLYDSKINYLEQKYNEKFYLSFPKILFRIMYKNTFQKYYDAINMKIAFTNNSKKLFIPPLFNIYRSLQVCIILPNIEFENVEELCKCCVSSFWSTSFNDTMYDSFLAGYGDAPYKVNSIMGDPRKWENKTKTNPNWIPNSKNLIEYSESYETFCDFIKDPPHKF